MKTSYISEHLWRAVRIDDSDMSQAEFDALPEYQQHAAEKLVNEMKAEWLRSSSVPTVGFYLGTSALRAYSSRDEWLGMSGTFITDRARLHCKPTVRISKTGRWF